MQLNEYLIAEATRIYDGLSTDQKSTFDGSVPVVFSTGKSPSIMVVARDLGRTELELGWPLVGVSGLIFRSAAAIAGIGDYIYCTNIVPFKPVDNKVFDKDIINSFRTLLEFQIETIKPKIIITLGGDAYNWFDPKNTIGIMSICEYRQGIREYTFKDYKIQLVPVPHPSYFYRKGIRHPVTKENLERLKVGPEALDEFSRLFMEPILRSMKFFEGADNDI